MIIIYMTDVWDLSSSPFLLQKNELHLWKAIVTILLFLSFEVFAKIRLVLLLAHPTELLPSLKLIIHSMRLKKKKCLAFWKLETVKLLLNWQKRICTYIVFFYGNIASCNTKRKKKNNSLESRYTFSWYCY